MQRDFPNLTSQIENWTPLLGYVEDDPLSHCPALDLTEGKESYQRPFSWLSTQRWLYGLKR